MRIVLAGAAVALTACATTSGIQPIGPDTYLLSRQMNHGFSGAAGLKGEVLQEANAYCAAQGKQMKLHSMQERPTTFSSYAGLEVQFLCLAKGDKELTRPKLEPRPDVVIQDRR